MFILPKKLVKFQINELLKLMLWCKICGTAPREFNIQTKIQDKNVLVSNDKWVNVFRSTPFDVQFFSYFNLTNLIFENHKFHQQTKICYPWVQTMMKQLFLLF